MTTSNKNYKECLNLTKKHVECIEKESYNILANLNIKNNSDEVESAVYIINQKAHELKKAINTYCS